ncbi:MAG: hypothetical protein HC842_07240, partial [Cytophagales bacterium]|nr:hypothetical protein [Cytophagales bacterium]
MKQRLGWMGLFWLWLVPCWAVPPQVAFSRIGPEHGLPHTNINDIIQDDFGFLWLGTSAGLVRYDGYDFITYRRELGHEASGTFEVVQIEKGDSCFWLHVRNEGLFRFSLYDETFTHIDLPDGLGGHQAWSVIEDLHRDMKGRLWVGTRNGLVCYWPKQRRFQTWGEEDGILPGSFVGAVLEDDQQQIWLSIHHIYIGKEGSVLGRFDPEQDCFEPSDELLASYHGTLQSQLVYSALSSRQQPGSWWLATDYGISLVDHRQRSISNYTFAPYSGDMPDLIERAGVNCLYEDSTGLLWVGSKEEGLLTFEKQNESWTYLGQASELPMLGSKVQDIFLDKYGVMWLAAFESGLQKVEIGYGGFQRLATPLAIDRLLVTQVYEDRQGNWWIGTFADGLYEQYKDGGYTNLRNRPGDWSTIGAGPIRGIDQDQAGRMWIASWKGIISQLDPQTGTLRRLRGGHWDLQGWAFTALVVDRYDRVWIGSEDACLEYLEPGSLQAHKFLFDPQDS